MKDYRLMKNRGITLIALVVTIIVLLILAGISISMLTGQNGILNRAVEARKKTEEANRDEQRKLAQAEALMSTGKTTYKGVTLPEGFAPTKIDGEDSIDEGLVITDGYGNEYVWVEVPKTTEVYPTAGLGITNFTDDEYTKIENDLHTYTSEYRTGISCSDEWYNAKNDSKENYKLDWYQEENDYNVTKKKMLKSIYENGGFWVGRYEAGIAENRKSSGDATAIPLTQKNLYPYNYVTRTQANALAKKVESGSYTSSLMFGVQYDLVLKYIEVKKATTKDNLISNSKMIGNYYDNLWELTNENAKYSIDNGDKFDYCPKPYSKTSASAILLTTGADKVFSLANIYDIAGNLREWTLEKSSNDNSHPCIFRGGDYSCLGSDNPANYRNLNSTASSSSIIGFRISLY